MDAKDLATRVPDYHIDEVVRSPPTCPGALLIEDSEDDRPIMTYNTNDNRPPSRRADAPPFPQSPINADLALAQSTGHAARSRRLGGRNSIRRFPGEEDITLARSGYETSDSYYYHSIRRHRRHRALNGDTLAVTSTAGSSAPASSSRDPMRARHYHRLVAAPAPSQASPLSQGSVQAAQLQAVRARVQAAQTRATSAEPQTNPIVSSPNEPSKPLALPQQDEFNVTMDCSDPSDDDEELSSPDILADLYRRDRTLYIDHSPELDLASDDEDDTANTVRALRNHNARLGAIQGIGRRELPSRVQIMDVGRPDDEEKTVLAPHARFFIEKEKSSVSITFEPEV